MSMDNLHRAMKEWFEACNEHEKALAEFKGYSWDYAGYYLIQRMQEAQEEFEKALNTIIDERVKTKLEAL